MDVQTNHLVTEEFFETMTDTEKAKYQPIPPELNRAASRKLGVNKEIKVSFVSNGKLSKWARKQRAIAKRP